jgi:flavin reductase (DIM6/NTAB) family NADH-FMN oxidoreductase RutF
MKERMTLVYQLLIVALLGTLIFMAWKQHQTAPSPAEAAAPPLQPPPFHLPFETDGSSESSQATDYQELGEDIGNGWRRLEPTDIPENPIVLVDGYKGILAMGDRQEHNAMTIGWGTLGMLWRKPVFNVYVSSSRFSHSLMEKFDTFTVSFFNMSHLEDVMYLGHHSGRDGDKISHTHLHLNYTKAGTPMFDDAFLIIECRKLYGGPFDVTKMAEDPAAMYASGKMGVHSVYVGEILNVYMKNDNR